MNRKEFYNTLSEDVKAKIKACKTEEEMMRVLAEEKIELDSELLESVSGGVSDWDTEKECRANSGSCKTDCEKGCPNHCTCN